MVDKTLYLNNNDEQISAQKRAESDGNMVATVKGIGVLAGYLILKRKYNISKAISSEIRASGRYPQSFNKFVLAEASTSRNPIPINRLKDMVRNKVVGSKGYQVSSLILKPLPSRIEQRQITIARINSNASRSGLNNFNWIGILPGEPALSNSPMDFIRTMIHGPEAAIAPRARLAMPGKYYQVGSVGGVVSNGMLYNFNKAGRVTHRISGVRTGIMGTTGAGNEFAKNFGHIIKPLGRDEFARARIPAKYEIMLERKRGLIEREIQSMRRSLDVPQKTPTDFSVLRKLEQQYDRAALEDGLNTTAYNLFTDNKPIIKSAYDATVRNLVRREKSKSGFSRAYNRHLFFAKIGMGPQFTRHNAGEAQGLFRKFKGFFRKNTLDPVSGRPYAINAPRYIDEKHVLSGVWENESQGKFYMYSSFGGFSRRLHNFIEGTFFKQFENLTGMGFSIAPTLGTNLLNKMVGAKSGSNADFFIRNYIGRYGRLATLGIAGMAVYNTANYLAKQTTGWSVTEAAGKIYTSAREFQQKTLDYLHITDKAREQEKAFPGIWNSPLSKALRAGAPYILAKGGSKLFGANGAMVGLAVGISIALVTWGDITQDPEELHRIYTGEQDIPIRAGRWWMFGRTPFGGGKISYWRPHWYPLMRSRYKYQGQLWDSETEEFASKGPLAPILTPLLLHKKWDPYAWEKKHYRDRPYPLTGELFEPTMPFAWLGNLTIGRLIKPQRIMHPEYWGVAQGEPGTSRTMVMGGSERLGVNQLQRDPMLPNVDPGSAGWQASQAAYTLAEQMGLRGYALNVLYENMTGRPDFLPEGPVIQTARRATGYEREYWDMNIGDPANLTEFYRRLLPHRRRAIEEYNPIPNEMPDWMPGEDYFINFRTGDPYTKVELGEARLPGAGYESLHKLHSNIPKVYDAVDRFLVLSDVAPYSDEYRHYLYLAKYMSKGDKYWEGVVNRHIEQRAKTQQEYDFLSLKAPEDIPDYLKPYSEAYRKALATLGPGGIGGAIDPFLAPVIWEKSFPLVSNPLAKFVPYRTAEQTYKDFRLHGTEFTEWGSPYRDFIKPAENKSKDMLASIHGDIYIPPEEYKRREYEEYFDRLQYIKNKKLADMARSRGDMQLASKYTSMSNKTMTGVNPYNSVPRLMGSVPKRERAFLDEFSKAATQEERDRILSMVSPQMARIYQAQWNITDNRGRAPRRTDTEIEAENVDFFSRHRLPESNWSGWNPDVDIKDVQLKVVKQEAMNIHSFDLWESQERAMKRRPYVPDIGGSIYENRDPEDVRRALQSQLEIEGYGDSQIFITRTPSRTNSASLNVKVKKDRTKEREKYSQELFVRV